MQGGRRCLVSFNILREIVADWHARTRVFDAQNLTPAAEGEVYNLWVATEPGDPPIYVGSLPEASATGADSFDFSLGSTMVLPSGFVLTRDPRDAPAKPTQDNTVLQGPPSS